MRSTTSRSTNAAAERVLRAQERLIASGGRALRAAEARLYRGGKPGGFPHGLG